MGTSKPYPRVCLVPNVSGVGGMVSFRDRLVKGLAERGIGISMHLSDRPYAAILVIGGTRDLAGLVMARRRGVRIVQRLDGMNWIHRHRQTGWRHFMRAEYGNLVLSLIRSRIADHIVYQSEFSRGWWERVHGAGRTSWQVVYNGVDLERYHPTAPGSVPADHVRMLLVEGAMAGGYEWGLETAVQLAECLKDAHSHNIKVRVVGRVSDSLQRVWQDKAKLQLEFSGQVPAENVPALDRSAHFLYAADLMPACPNSVIEALGCGLPVVAFSTGALPEIITGEAGRLAPYGGDPWKLEPPDIHGLAEAAHAVINNQATCRGAARRRAEQAFGLDRMVQGYLEALEL